MRRNNVLPCPFCGNENDVEILSTPYHISTDARKWNWYVTCGGEEDGGCGARSAIFNNLNDAITAWNMRIKYETINQ